MIGASPYAARGYRPIKLETHLHTLHSDGQASVAAMFEACATAGYQAVALTDHNTQAGVEEAREIAARLGLIFLAGVEVTSFRGHAVVLGVEHVPEWRDLETRGMDAMAAEVHAQGGLVTVAHPAALGSPLCSGCAWEWPVGPASVDLWEVFSAPRPDRAVAIALWRQVLAAGGHAAPVAAGDVHSVAAAAAARPATYVYAADNTAGGVLEALRAGRLCASAQDGPLEFWLERGPGETALIGERAVGPGWAPRTTSAQATIGEVDTGRGQAVYAQVYDARGDLTAISAPIWMLTST